ncbi:MAG TPA: sodium:proton antiporter [Methanosarcinales archaeon]|nr:sodium:proton antiporter [Methanosarcinales archaeon]
MESMYLIAIIALVLGVGIGAQVLGKELRIPSIIFLLMAGIILGPEVSGIIEPSKFGSGLEVIVAISVAIIIFDGGLEIDIRNLRKIKGSILGITTIGVVITVFGATLAALALINLPLNIALLYGVLVAATGPTVITPIIKSIKINYKVSNILSAESVLNDGISVILAAFVFEFILEKLSGLESFLFIIMRLSTAAAFGIFIGFIVIYWFKKEEKMITEQYARLFTIIAVLATFVGAELIGNQSGVLAVAILGIVIGSSEIPHKKVIKEFKEDISIILLSIIFIFLSALIRFRDITNMGFNGIILVLLLIFLIRPIAVFASTQSSNLLLGERLFISFVAPRGIVPASMATYFAFRLEDINLGGRELLGIIFLTIVITVLLSGTLARFIAQKTGVIPMEILIIGGGGVGRTLAERLAHRGENVIVIDTRKENCQKVMKLGIKAVHGDGGDLNVLKKAGIKNAKYLVATTDQDKTNLMVCQVARTMFGFDENKLVARVNNPDKLQAFRDLGIRAMSPALSTALILDGMVGHPHLFSMLEVSKEGDIVEIKVTNPKVIGNPIKDIKLPHDSLIVLIRRKDQSLIAHGDTTLEDGDYITIVGKSDAVIEAANMMR